MRKNIRIGEILIQDGKITDIQLQVALNFQKKNPSKRLGDILIELEMISEEEFEKSLARRLNMEYFDGLERMIDVNVTSHVSEALVRKNNIAPLHLKEGILTLATNDPLNFYGIDDIAIASGFQVKVVLSTKNEITNAIDRLYTKAQAKTAMDNIHTEFGDLVESVNAIKEDSITKVDSSPIVQLVNSLIKEAALQNASDIHIEPLKNRTRIRFRIDGDLVEHTNLSSNSHEFVVTRIKIIGGMNIAEKRVPLDGGFTMDLGDRKIDIRVSSLPTIYGEKIVMRLLGNDQNVIYELERIGFSDENLKIMQRILLNSNGVILVSGPTGSGKTTTSYAILQEISKPMYNVVSIEDPVEKAFENLNQIQINEKAGLTFAKGLRSILRQDPDVIMIGEIRDEETAEIAVRSAITGHLVLSTIHTNDAISAVARMTDMGVEPYLLSSALRGVVSQRLVKRLCTHCKEEKELTEIEQGVVKEAIPSAYHAKGCSYCNFTGYKGRLPIHEILRIDSKLSSLISKKAHIDTLREAAEAAGITSLKTSVINLMKQGETSYEEAIRIIYSME